MIHYHIWIGIPKRIRGKSWQRDVYSLPSYAENWEEDTEDCHHIKKEIFREILRCSSVEMIFFIDLKLSI